MLKRDKEKKTRSMSEQWFNSSIFSIARIWHAFYFIVWNLALFLYFTRFHSYSKTMKCSTIGSTRKQFMKIYEKLCTLLRFASLVKCAVSHLFKCEIGEFIAQAIGSYEVTMNHVAGWCDQLNNQLTNGRWFCCYRCCCYCCYFYLIAFWQTVFTVLYGTNTDLQTQMVFY